MWQEDKIYPFIVAVQMLSLREKPTVPLQASLSHSILHVEVRTKHLKYHVTSTPSILLYQMHITFETGSIHV